MIGRLAARSRFLCRAARFALALFMLLAVPASLAHAHDFGVAQAAIGLSGADHDHHGSEGSAPHAVGLDCCLHHAPAGPVQEGPALPLRFAAHGLRVIGPQDLTPDNGPKTRLDRPPRPFPSI